MNTLVEYAKSFLGTPYIWGGSSPINGFDCSGFAQWLLESIGIDPVGDQNAMALHNELIKKGRYIPNPAVGAFCFYGRNTTAISHVSFCISPYQIIEAGGGDHTTINAFEAAKKNACVRIRPATHRKDRTAIIMPEYPTWVLNG